MSSKNKIDIGIVMVNYNNYRDTIECIESFLEKIDTDKFKIIVVDNDSPNKSGLILKEKYSKHKYVDIIISDSNIGNGAGWNKGLEYLRKLFNPKYSILSDNDVILLDNHLFRHLEEEYKLSGFAACGPLINSPDGRKNSNPIFDIFYSRENAKYDLRYHKKMLRATKLHLDGLYRFYRAHNPFVRMHKRKVYENRRPNSESYLTRKENIVIHGCFMIFSPKYFEHFDGLDVRTFMYAEEDILYAHLIKENLKSVYTPKIEILHKGDSSVKNTYESDRKRRIFLMEQYIKAINAYLLLIDELHL